jgi:predicted DNA-binding transcriptional regulator AlpA
MIGISTCTLWRLLSAGKLPTPVRIGGSTRWRRDEVREWIRNGCPTPDPRAASKG